MTILDVCANLDHVDNDGVIYARRIEGEFAPASEAAVVMLSRAEQDMPAREVAARRCPGLDYCLEISIAKEAVQVWSLWREGARPTPSERAEAVCYKANNDAWGPPNFPIESGGTDG
jgi:hypothetical protein